MSLVYITYHDENIFNASPKEETYEFKQKPYRSKYSAPLRKQAKIQHIIQQENGKKLLTDSNKYRNRTMGYAETPLSPPCEYLRKNHGIKWQRLNDHICPPQTRKIPDIPKFIKPKSTEKPFSVHAKSDKDSVNAECNLRRYFKDHKHRADFVWINIDRAKSLKPKKPPPRTVDTPTGHKQDVLPLSVCSKNFGKVPCYLRVYKKMLQKVQNQCAEEQKKRDDRCLVQLTGVRKLTTNERYEILTGLKTNYAELSKLYQGLPLYVDTIAKQLRKGKLEKDLRQLEQDIFLIESNPQIFVSDY